MTCLATPEQPTRKGGWRGAGWGLATGGAAIGAIAGHVSTGMNRGDLKDLGEHLDAGHYGLIVVAAADVSAKVERAIANDITEKQLDADEQELDVAEASSDG